MQLRELSVPGAWEITPRQVDDHRGLTLEAFSDPAVRRMSGHRFDLERVTVEVSGEGVLRGLHHDGPDPRQARYLLCPSGTVFAVVVDIRLGSPAFGEWSGVLLDGVGHRALYVPEGVARGYLSLESRSTVLTLVSDGWTPGGDHVIDATDHHLAIDWPTSALDGTVLEHVLDHADGSAPSLLDAAAAGELPRHDTLLERADGRRRRDAAPTGRE